MVVSERSRGPGTATRPAALLEAGRGLDRRDLAVFALLVLVVFASRLYRLDVPRSMYFDERWHAGSATEFLQDWRYGMPHDLAEVTHPHLAKYFMAAGLVAFGDDRVTGGGNLATTVTDATFEPSYADPAQPGGLGGDRIIVATGSGIRIAEHGNLTSTTDVAVPGAISVAADAAAHWTVVGTSDGGVWQLQSSDLTTYARTGSAPRARQIATLVGPVVRVWALGGGRVAALTQAGRLSSIDGSSGGIIAALDLPGLQAVLPFGPPDRHLAALALPNALAVVDTGSMAQIQLIGLNAPATGLAYVDGGDQPRRERDLLQQPAIYVATGASALVTYTVGDDGTLTPAAAVPMPGPIRDVKWDRPTNLVHVLGTSPDGVPTIYVVEPHGNAVFADATLGLDASSWILDVQPNDPGNDRERAIAFGATGTFAAVDVGSHAFAWRLPGVVLGALSVGLLYVLARFLFRRRAVGIAFGAILATDGLMFQQSRIAMNDVYVGFFVAAGFALLAYFLQSRASGPRARNELLLIPPALGVLFGLGLASKWVAAYAIGGTLLIIFLRSRIGRRIALAGMIGLTGVLGYQAVADDPANVIFLLLILGLTVLLGVGIIRGEGSSAPTGEPGPAWLDPRWRRGLPFLWIVGSLLVVPVVVYVASYVPWALSVAGGPQLFDGWPVGHTGQTFLDLQAQMYRYHNEFRFPHGAGSPWWAWPFDLKPLWGYLETFVDGSQATVLGVGNPVLLWLSVPAAGYAAWQSWRRRSWALGFVVIAFLGLWLPWARIDRVAFNYHYFVALPFAFLLLAWFLVELVDRPTRHLVRFARGAFAVVLYLPTLLWLLKGPLCTVAGVDRVDPGSTVCGAPFTAVAVPVAIWSIVATAILVLGVLRRTPRQMVAVMAGLAAIVSIALYPALAAAGLPNGMPWVYQGLLPSWDSSFQFWSNSAVAVAHPLLGVGSLVLTAVAVTVTGAAMWYARRWGADPTSGAGPSDVPTGRRVRTLPPTPLARPRLEYASLMARVPRLRQRAGRPGVAMEGVGVTTGGASFAAPRPRLPVTAISARRLQPFGRSLPATNASPGLRGTILALAAISLVGALAVDRFSGFGGPWLWNFDMSLANYPFASYFHEALSKGTLPLWNDRIGMGFPLYAEGQIGALYPPNWLIFQLPPLIALDVARILHLVLAGVGGGLLVLRMTGSRTGAATTAIVVVLCGGIASKLEWTQVVTVYGWMPWVFLALMWRRPAPTTRLIALAGVFWGVQALGGHPPYWVLTGIAAGVLIVAQSRTRRGLGQVVLFGLVGVGVGAVQLIPTLLITTLSWRAQGVGAGALFEYSATPFDVLAVAFGNAFVPAQGSGWDLFQSWYPGGSVWATLEVYAFVGLPAVILAVCGLGTRRARPVLALALVMIAIPLIGVFQPGLWAAIPGLNGLRHPIRAYLLLDLALAIGAGIGVARLGRRISRRPAAIVTGVAVGGYLGISVVAVALPGLFDGLVRLFWPYVPVGREGTIRDLAVAALTTPWPIIPELGLGAVTWVILRRRGRLPWVRLGAIAAVALPLLFLSPSVNQTRPESSFTLEGSALADAVRALRPGQVLTINEPFYSGLPTVLDGVGARAPHVYTSQFGLSLRLQASEDLIANLRAGGPGSPLALAVGVDTVVAFDGSCGGDQVATDAGFRATICRNPAALRPPYWLPASAVLSVGPGSILPFAPVDAVVDPARVLQGSAGANISSWSDGSASLRVNTPADGYLFIDRTWWPAWQVTVDGAPVTPVRAWGGQLVPVKAGAHAIEQRFLPWDAGLGLLVTIATLVAVGIWVRRRAPVITPEGGQATRVRGSRGS